MNNHPSAAKLNRRALWNPDMYHGWSKTKNFFEGWYFKIVDPSEKYALAFIPGISMDPHGNQHAFIQSLDGKKCKAIYHRFSHPDFQPSTTDFSLNIGDNSFSAQRIQLNLPEVKGELHFENTVPWPKMFYAPGIMGWYSFVPFMQCYHGVVSLNHELKGILTIEGKQVDFTGGKGYIEKDWGTSFPKGWIWIQTNHFNEPDTSLMVSVAHIPWLGSHFIGYIVGFWLKGKLYKFATYTGAKMKITILDNKQVSLSFTDKTHRLEVTGIKTDGGNLLSPISGEMTGKVNESLQATINVSLYQKGKLIFKDTGRNAGMELAGLIEKLL